MGKKSGSGPTQQVTDYRMSITYGICQGIVQSLSKIILNEEKVAWEDAMTAQGNFTLSNRSLFGGALKEGGIDGRVFYQPGTWDQLLHSEVSTRQSGLPPEQTTGYRGIATATFLGSASASGFLWGTNNPFIPPAWFRVTRIPNLWYPETAWIGGDASAHREPGEQDFLNPITQAEGGLFANFQGDELAVDWEAGYGYLLTSTSDMNTCGIRRFNLETMVEDRQATMLEITGGVASDAHPRNLIVGPDHFLYLTSGGANSAPIIKVDPDTFQEHSRFGFDASGLSNTTERFTNPNHMAVVRAGSAYYLLTGSIFDDVGVLDTHGIMTFGLEYVWGEGQTVDKPRIQGVVAGRSTGSFGESIGEGWILSSSTSTNGTLALHKILISEIARYSALTGLTTGIAFSKAVEFNASHIDPAATGFFSTNSGDLIYDPTDNSVIFITQLSYGGTAGGSRWLIKWAEGLGIVWKTELSAGVGGLSIVRSRLGGDYLRASASSNEIVTVSLATGEASVSTWTGTSAVYRTGRQSTDYYSESVVLHTNSGVQRIYVAATSVIVGTPDANPAHIIYECLTNRVWGMGTPVSSINDASFRAAALTLYNENFGLSMIWAQQDTIESFVREVLDHIEATLYVDPPSGEFVLKLIRNDYDPATLPIFDESNCVIESFQTRSPAEIINEIVVTWTNPENEQEETYTLQDLGGIVVLGGEVISDQRNYYGVRNATLAAELASRDLSVASAPLATGEITANRKGWRYSPGDVIKLSSAEHGAVEVIMRVVKIDYGEPKNPQIKVSLTQDIWSFERPVALPPPATEHAAPGALPEPAEYATILTLNYFLAGATVDPTQLSSAEYPDVYMAVLASTDQADAQDFQLYGEVEDSVGNTTMTLLGSRTFVTRGLLAEDWSRQATTTTAGFTDLTEGAGPVVGGFALIGPDGGAEAEMELVAFQSFTSPDWSVLRGILDTVPRAWPAGTLIRFFSAADSFEDEVVRSAAETVSYQVLTRTSLGLLNLGDAPLLTHVATERPHQPTRPANVTIDDEAWAEVDASGLPTVPVAWANRNRLTEDSQVLAWTAATVTPETGQTTRIRIRDYTTGTEISSISVAEGLTSYDLTAPDFGASSRVVVRVESERDGLSSLQAHEQSVLVASGYGYFYGEHYGGVAP